MRIVAIVDADGVITGLITAPEGIPRASIPNLPSNLSETEIDAPDITEELDTAAMCQKLNDLKSNFKVDLAAKKFMHR